MLFRYLRVSPKARKIPKLGSVISILHCWHSNKSCGLSTPRILIYLEMGTDDFESPFRLQWPLKKKTDKKGTHIILSESSEELLGLMLNILCKCTQPCRLLTDQKSIQIHYYFRSDDFTLVSTQKRNYFKEL